MRTIIDFEEIRNGKTDFTCPSCGYTASIEVGYDSQFTVRCQCDAQTQIFIQKPRPKRKHISIKARFGGIPVVIHDISNDGYLLRSETLLPDYGLLVYRLPNKEITQIKERAKLVRRNGKYYGMIAQVNALSDGQRAKTFWLSA